MTGTPGSPKSQECELPHLGAGRGELSWLGRRAIGDGGSSSTTALLGVSSLDLAPLASAGGAFFVAPRNGTQWPPPLVSESSRCEDAPQSEGGMRMRLGGRLVGAVVLLASVTAAS